MYNAQSFSVGSSLPSTSLGRSTSNGGQMVFPQGSADLQKAQQMFQQSRKQELNNFDCKFSDCNISHSGAVMAPIGSGVPVNFQASPGLMRYHSAPCSLATLAENANEVILHVSGARPDSGLSQILSNDSAITSESNSGAMKHNDSSQSSNIQPAKHLENQDDYSRMTVHNSCRLSRRRSNVAEENLRKNSHLATILENGIDVSSNSFCSSEMSMLRQIQGLGSGEQLVNDTFKHNPILYNSLNSSGETPGSLASTTKNNLVRHSSTPAGALSQVTSNTPLMAERGYLEGVVTSSTMGMATLASENSSGGNMVAPNRLSHHMNFLRQNSSPAQLLNQLNMDMDIPEIVDKFSMNVGHSSVECLVGCSSDTATLGNAGQGQGYIPSLSAGSWEDGTMLSGNYEGIQNSGRKRGRDMDEKMISGLHMPEKLKGEAASHSVSALGNHHFGLFKSTSAEMAMEKLLEDSVPCRIRAKRGCATHPRSIAERVRRTRISDRMRKLQELVPNMDKQTNTADMLDEAVEYVKLLQKQVEELSEKQNKCDCASRKRQMLTKHELIEEDGLLI